MNILNLPTGKYTREQQQRVEQALQNGLLPIIGKGCDRTVFDLGNGFICKREDLNHHHNYSGYERYSDPYEYEYQNESEYLLFQKLSNEQRKFVYRITNFWKNKKQSFLIMEKGSRDYYSQHLENIEDWESVEYLILSNRIRFFANKISSYTYICDIHARNISTHYKVFDYGLQ